MPNKVDPRNHPLYKAARRRLLAESGDTCGICGDIVDKNLPAGLPGSPEVDHIKSIDSGGHLYHRDNLQLTHKLCNQVKGPRGLKANNMVKHVATDSIGTIDNTDEDDDWS